MIRLFVTAAALALWSCSAGAQPRPPQGAAAPAPAAPQSPSRPSALGNLGANNKEPIKIDSDRLDVFDKEQRAVFTGSVVAVQGESTIKCTELTVLYDQQRGQARPGQAKPAPVPSAAGPGEGAIRQIDCKGPVTIVSRTQTATGDNATFDRTANRILLTGNVALSDGPNVTLGERIVYDLNSGVANVETKPGGRVRAMFVPGAGVDGKPGGGQAPSQPGGRRAPPTN
jgi:lipopolysaccharide export system protein LptA